TYLVAGFRSQRLAVVVTYRDEELAPGDPMHAWLADLLRLPSVSSLHLDRMSRDETEQQLSMLLAGRPDPHLVSEVVRRSAGNPYFSELLVRGLTVADEDLPAGLPAELTGALLAAWQGLAAAAREVMRLLAVAGRPVTPADLVEVAASRGIGAEAVTVALVEATQSGICVAHGGEMCWFRHPLLAEVLNATFVPGEAVPVHAAWAKTLQARAGSGIDGLQRLGDLAHHYEGAQDPAASLDTSLRAADLAKQLRALPEEAVHLRRAARLWPTVHDAGTHAVDAELDLLERWAFVSSMVGTGEETLAAWTRSSQLVDEGRDPLRASRIVRKIADYEYMTGRRSGEPFDTSERAVKLCEPYPDSPEYAAALAELSECHSWTDSFEAAQRYAEESLQAARRSGSHEALSKAYIALAYAYIRDERADHDSAEAVRHAKLTGDADEMTAARNTRGAYLGVRGRLAEALEIGEAALRECLDGGESNLVAFYAGAVARSLLIVGRHSDAERAIRQGLTLARTPHIGANVRLPAALLAVRRGDLDRARLHLQRAKELIPELEDRPGLDGPPLVVAEYLVASRQPDRALELLARTMVDQVVDPRVIDEMLMWGARSAAEMAEEARDRRDHARITHAGELLDRIVEIRHGLQPPPFEPLAAEDLILPALEAIYAAETARCLAQSPTSALWEEATRRCAAAGMRWEESVASHRWAHALLTEGASKTTIAGPLRSAYRLADQMSAGPLRQQVERLATVARITLDEPAPWSADTPDETPQAFSSLTRREREILGHLVAGRTYAEIAAALFISEKTVSVHVSNVLRKTGTASSREVAALAGRLGYATGAGPTD
ncbi:MAG: LuxR C-terminal-related transcriptional regulator, partial [Kribbellaceae bacterium]